VKIETSIPQGTTIAATTVATTMISITTTITTTIGSLEGSVHLRPSGRAAVARDRVSVQGGEKTPLSAQRGRMVVIGAT
jgi:hypothetical protein